MPDGRQLVAAVNPWTPTGVRQIDPIPLRILDPDTAALSKVQLGGVPKGRVVHNSFPFSTNGRWLDAAFVHPTEADKGQLDPSLGYPGLQTARRGFHALTAGPSANSRS